MDTLNRSRSQNKQIHPLSHTQAVRYGGGGHDRLGGGGLDLSSGGGARANPVSGVGASIGSAGPHGWTLCCKS